MPFDDLILGVWITYFRC